MIKKGSYVAWAFFLSSLPASTIVELKPQTVEAFDRYVRTVEAKTEGAPGGAEFLWVDSSPHRKRAALEGKVVAEPSVGKGDLPVPDGLIHDWMGAVFIPRVSLTQVLDLVQDYPNYKNVFKPEVQDSRLLSHNGDTFHIQLRLLKKQIITVVLDSEYDVQYKRLDQTRALSKSFSIRIAEVENSGGRSERELPPGHDHGFLWRLHSFWHFQQRDGGVYMECHAISLSRDVPAALAWLISPIIRSLPRDSLSSALEGTRRALTAHSR